MPEENLPPDPLRTPDAPSVSDDPPAAAVMSQEDLDLAELKYLEGQYAKLKAASAENDKIGKPNDETRAKKVEAFQRLAAIKRKYRLQ